MTVIPPLSNHNVSHATGGGLLDSVKQAMASASGGAGSAGGAGAAAGAGAAGAAGTSTAAGGAKGDGSVGLFDGVLLKMGLGGAAGALAGWVMPFGGPVIGGIVGALGGAALGVFGNWKKMNDIKKSNQAILDQMGVGTQDPQVQQILQSGQVQQLLPMAQQEMGGTGAGTQQGGQYPTTQTAQYPTTQTGQYPIGGGVAQNGGVGQTPYPAQVGLDSTYATQQVPTTQADPNANPGQSPFPTQAAVGTSSPAVDASIYTGQVPEGFAGGTPAGGLPQYVNQDAPPVPTAVQQDPSVARNLGAGSIMSVAQASATLGDGTTVPMGVGGGASDQSAQLKLQIDALQKRIDELTAALAQTSAGSPTTEAGPGTETAPSTQTAVPAAA